MCIVSWQLSEYIGNDTTDQKTTLYPNPSHSVTISSNKQFLHTECETPMQCATVVQSELETTKYCFFMTITIVFFLSFQKHMHNQFLYLYFCFLINLYYVVI